MFQQMFSQKNSRSEGAVVIEDQRAERSAAEWGTARWFPRITTQKVLQFLFSTNIKIREQVIGKDFFKC